MECKLELDLWNILDKTSIANSFTIVTLLSLLSEL